jgi:hypothetical protein
MLATHTEADVEKVVGQLEIQFCTNASWLLAHGTTLTEYVETGLREVGALPPIAFAGLDQRQSHLAAHYPVIAGRLAQMQRQMPACG